MKGFIHRWAGIAICSSILVFHFQVKASQNTTHCLDAQKVADYVRDFRIRKSTFGKEDLCDPKNELYQLYQSLLVIEAGQYSGRSRSKFIHNFVPKDKYLAWNAQRIYQLRRGHDIPYATAYNSGGYVTVQDGWAQLSSLGKVGTLIHEARHTDGYGHTACKFGPYKSEGVSGCDRSVESGGSHGVEMEYYARVVLEGENFHPVYQSMARLMLLARGHFVFNKPPLQADQGVFLRGVNGESFFFQSGTYYRQFPLNNYGNWLMKRGSMGPVLFDGQKALSVDIYNAQVTPQKDEFSYYKLLDFPRPEPFQDMEEIDQGGKKYLVALGQSGQLYQYAFRRSRWNRIHSPSDYLAFKTRDPLGRSGLFVVHQSGQVERWDLARRKLQALPELWPAHVVDIVEMGSELVELRQNGQLVVRRTQQVVEGLPALMQAVEVPIYVENIGRTP